MTKTESKRLRRAYIKFRNAKPTLNRVAAQEQFKQSLVRKDY